MRSATIAGLVERFGDNAADIDSTGAAFVEEAVASALIESGIDGDEAERIADRCRVAVLEAAQAVDTLTALIEA